MRNILWNGCLLIGVLKKKICCGWGFFFVRNWYQIEQSCNTNVSDTFPNNIPSFNFLSKGEAYVETTFCDACISCSSARGLIPLLWVHETNR